MSKGNVSELTSLLREESTSDFSDEPDLIEEEYNRHNLSLPKLPILISLWLGSFLVALDGTIVANIMNRIAEEFEESDKKQWIATSFLLTNTAFQPLYGKLSDITGRRFALFTAQFFFGIGCLLTCFARNVTEFSIARAVCGIGGGGISAMSSITVSDICTAKERGIYQGYANVVFGSGQLLGAPLGGFVINKFGWRTIFSTQVPMVVLCIILGHRNVNIKLAHIPPANERFTRKNLARLDFLGSITLVFSISGILFLCSSNLNKLMLSVFTALSFITFTYNELFLAPERILPLELLKGSFGLSSLLTVFSSFVIFGDVFRSPIYLQLVQNMSITKSGLFVLFGSVASACASLVTGWILRRTRMDMAKCAFLIVFVAFVLQLLGLSCNALLLSQLEPNQTSYLAYETKKGDLKSYVLKSDSFCWKLIYITSMVFNSYGYASLLVATLVSIVFTVDKSQQATVTGIFYLWRSIGNVLGASLTLSLYDKALSDKLWKFMSTNGLKDAYKPLIRDSSYLRHAFSGKELAELLDIYNTAFIISYLPNISIAVVAVGVALVLIRVYRPKEVS